MEKRPLKIIGCGGHGRVLADIARAAGESFSGYLDDNPLAESNARVEGPVREVIPYTVGDYRIAIGIGDSRARSKFADMVLAQGGELARLIHPSAVIAPDVIIGEGTVVMAGAVINTGAEIGRLVIVNTRAIIEHDCLIEDCVMIGPGSVLAGGVTVRKNAFVAAGATLIPCIEVGAGAYVAAGATVTRKVSERTLVAGCPAIEKRKLPRFGDE